MALAICVMISCLDTPPGRWNIPKRRRRMFKKIVSEDRRGGVFPFQVAQVSILEPDVIYKIS